MVEDAPPGIEAARAAGAAVVGVTSTHRGGGARRRPTSVIPTLESLPAVPGALLRRRRRASGQRRALTGDSRGIAEISRVLRGSDGKPASADRLLHRCRKRQRDRRPPSIRPSGRRRTSLRSDDRPGGRCRRHRDSRVLRDRLCARSALPVAGASTLARSNGPHSLVRHREQRAEPCGQPAAAVPRGDLARARLLDVEDAHRRIADPMLVGLRDGGVAVPVRRDDRLPDRAPARVPRGRARARARDRGRARRGSPTSSTSTASTAASRSRRTFLRCPSCLRRLKEPCAVCGKPLDPRWKICPYCEAEVGQPGRGSADGGRAAPPRRRAGPAPPRSSRGPRQRPGDTSERAAASARRAPAVTVPSRPADGPHPDPG